MIKAGYHKEAALKDYLAWKRELRDDNVLVCQFREEFETLNSVSEEWHSSERYFIECEYEKIKIFELQYRRVTLWRNM